MLNLLKYFQYELQHIVFTIAKPLPPPTIITFLMCLSKNINKYIFFKVLTC